MVYFVAVSHFVRPGEFLSVVTPRLMEDTMEHSVPMQKFGRVGSSGQTCMETLKNLSGVAQDVRSMGTSIPDVWGVDFMGPFPMLEHCEYILVAVDYMFK